MGPTDSFHLRTEEEPAAAKQRFNYASGSMKFLSLSVAQQPDSALGHLIAEVSKSHTIRQTHARARASGRTPLNERSARR